jgi:hypothetical protein
MERKQSLAKSMMNVEQGMLNVEVIVHVLFLHHSTFFVRHSILNPLQPPLSVPVTPAVKESDP